jgi:hypothetical protein
VREWDRGLTGQLAVSTRSVLFAHLRSIFMAAVDDELIAKNPCSVRSVSQPRPVSRRVVPWSREEVAAIREGLPARYRPLLDLGRGLRSASG